MIMAKSRIEYLDGMKLIMCYLVILAHYFMAYIPNGYIGYGSVYTETEKTSAFIESLPLSLFTNTSIQLYIFFAIIALITTTAFYHTKDSQVLLERQFIKRYFRFLIPVAVAVLLTYGLNQARMLRFENIHHISGSTWILSQAPTDVSFWEALYIAVVKCFFVPDTGILATLWCMDIIFIGSMLTYGLLAVVGKSKRRYTAYIVCTLFCIPFPKYLIFLVGIICGDLLAHGLGNMSLTKTKREILAFSLLLLGIVVGVIPSVFVVPPITLAHTYSLGTGLILLGIMLSEIVQKILSTKILVSQSKYAFSILLVQFPILLTASTSIFNVIYAATGQYLCSFWIMFVICAAFSHIAAIVFYYLFEKPSAKLADFIFNKIPH